MTRRPFNIMAKPIGPRCNIACSYCYYLDKETLFPEEKKFRMSDEVLEAYTRQLIDASLTAGMREVTFAWQGGEPTMLGVEFYAKALALQRSYAPAGITVTNVLQTNGMLLDDDWGRFLHDNGVLVGISIDGPKQVHDRYRLDRAGRPSFDAVIRGLDVLQRHGVAHNALTTVHRANGGKGREVYRFLKGLGIEHMQFIPIAERGGPDGLAAVPQIDGDPGPAVTDWSVRPRAYGKFLCDVFDTWIKRDVGRIFVQHFDAMLGKWLGRPGGLCVFAETCGDGLALEHDGSLYSCDHYVFPDYRLGRITDTPLDQMLWTDRQTAFGQHKRDSLTAQCRACPFRAACNGGCPKHRFATSRSGEAGHNYFCESYTMFFHHARPRLNDMARLVASGRSAAEVMA
ncbi:anaerobic sulfatase maturase [Roseibacterium beibuensis]|uniref:Anaerobic sulfatase maturase n=1 Tax=[Roseibacterium] beibuensis TaxID=1193142 RepID=A0ABP9LEY7_9RHOB|nr:anaerobic sulfatase maturase [Roseibacterium beibuensis]MCS6626516.1 anaerobic sulfatase maturase [Roseibacterium beibuensis]